MSEQPTLDGADDQIALQAEDLTSASAFFLGPEGAELHSQVVGGAAPAAAQEDAAAPPPPPAEPLRQLLTTLTARTQEAEGPCQTCGVAEPSPCTRTPRTCNR